MGVSTLADATGRRVNATDTYTHGLRSAQGALVSGAPAATTNRSQFGRLSKSAASVFSYRMNESDIDLLRVTPGDRL